jgi:uroporphyrinogen-III synthase
MVKQSQPPTVLLTRPLAASERFAGQVMEALGPLPLIIAPLQSVALIKAVPPEGPFDAVLFTSENALRAVEGWTLPQRALCVGERTAQAARAAGFDAESAGGDAMALADLIRAKGLNGPLLHPHGREVRQDFAALGLNVRGVVVYETLPQSWTPEAMVLLDAPYPVLAPIFSPRSAESFQTARQNHPAPVWIAALSPAVAEVLILRPADRIAISDRPDAGGMIAAMERLLLDGVGQG